MFASLALLILTVITSLFCIGLVGLSQNIALRVRIYFSLAIIFLTSWTVLLFMSNEPGRFVLFFNRAVYVSPIVGLFFFSQFFGTYYNKGLGRHLTGWVDAFFAVVSLVGAVIAGTRLNVIGVEPRILNGQIVGYSIVPGRLSILVAVIIVTLSGILLFRLALAYRTADKRNKKPLRLIFITLALAIGVSLIANVFTPLLFGGSDVANAMSNITAIIFIMTVAYSVLRYSFLDVRLLVIRSLGYVAGLAIVLLLAGFAQSVLFNSFGLGSHSLNINEQVVLIALFCFAALSFTPLRMAFGRITRSLFFKEGYDQAKLIASFNADLVKRTKMSDLLADTVRNIDQAFKPTFCALEVSPTASTPEYIVGANQLTKEQRKRVIEAVRGFVDRQVVVVALANAHNGDKALVRTLESCGIEALVRIIQTTEGAESLLGYVALGPKGNGEIYNKTDASVLGIIANALALAVQNALHFEQIQQFNITLQERINDATRKLRRTNQRLRELDETKDDFISMASHQLRTPLTSVKGYLSLVLEGDAGKLNETQAKMLRQAFSSSQRMVFLITDLLNISRLKTGKFVIETTPVDLSALVQEEVEQLHESAEIKQITLSFTKPATFPKLMLDETKVRQVIMNYIDNALYYTPVGGKVAVELTEKPATVELRVVDSGIGVPKAEQPHLFTKFYRATNARKARPDGTGLGLFMAKKAITAQGGSIVFSSHEGHGSTFGFVFSKTRLKVPENVSAVQHSLTAQIDADVAADKKRQKQPA